MTFSCGAAQPVFNRGGKKPPRRWRKNALPGQKKEEVKENNQKEGEIGKNETAGREGMWDPLSPMLWGSRLSPRDASRHSAARQGVIPAGPASLFSRRGNI